MPEINFEWTPLEGAAAYRLTFRDAETGDLVVRSEPFTEPRYSFDASQADGRAIEARLGIRRDGADEEDDEAWEDWGPDVPVPAQDDAADATLLTWEGVSPVHRLIIADQTTGNKVLDRPVLGTSYSYVPGEERGHDLVMRVRAWRDGDWDEGTGWEVLPLPTMLGEVREPPPPLASDPDAGLLLVFTIDTEGFLARQLDPNPKTTVDELVFGDFGNDEGYGIGLHMDLLEHFGYRGCFFLDVLSAYQYGEDQLKRAVDAIMGRGHEVQLHLHDEHVRNSDDRSIRALAGDLNAKDRDQFRAILELGVEVFERLVGKPPIAYRAGGYRITDEHFPVLEELGIRFDSSVNAYFHSQVSDWMRTRTQPHWIGDVLELPVSWTLVRDKRSAPETRALAPNATAGDPVSVMPASRTDVPWVETYVSHSLELMHMEREISDEELEAFKRNIRERVREEIAENVIKEVSAGPRLINGKLDEERVYRVAGLLRRIADRDDARCAAFTDLAEISDRFPRDRRLEPVDPVPAIDRPHGAATVTGTRIYSQALLSELSFAGARGRGSREDDDAAVTTLANADVGWEGSDVALIGEDSAALDEWLERRGVARVDRYQLPSEKVGGEFDIVAWTSGFEQCAPAALGDRLEAAADMLRDGGSLVLRVRTLGVALRADQDGAPPLAELVFPATAESGEVTAWDAGTFTRWLAARGFEVVAERRVARSRAELKAAERFADKLDAIREEELQTAALDLTLRRAPDAEPAGAVASGAVAGTDLLARFDVIAAGDDVLEVRSSDSDEATEISEEDVTALAVSRDALVEGTLDEESCDVMLCRAPLGAIELERLDDATRAIYRTLRPGGNLLLGAGEGDGPATETTVVVSLLRAGLEVVATESSGSRRYLRLLRPLELPDIVRFSGGAG